MAINPEGIPFATAPKEHVILGCKEGVNCEEIIDAQGLYLSPGVIDIHIHGAGGKDVMEGTKEAIEVIGLAIAKHGTISFCPTTMTMDASISNFYRMIDGYEELITTITLAP